jgi:aromatic ring-opening dioxygenase catalytic subunit (LigB family)
MFRHKFVSSLNNMTRAPVIALFHGGGPMPILNDPSSAELTKSLKTRVPSILKLGTPEAPRALVVVTAHWETDVPTVSNKAKHDLYYDYYGFPPETYNLKYDAPGSPETAAEVTELFQQAGVECKLDPVRGK